MIVKKLWRSVKVHYANKEIYGATVRDYIGYFLFGCIPLYIIMLNKVETLYEENEDEENIQYGIYKKYEKLL